MQHATPVRSSRVTAATLAALVISVLPAFLVGGLAVLLRADLGFSETRLGVAISAFYATSAAGSVLGGRLAQRVGGMRATSLGVGISTCSLLGIAVATRSWGQLVTWLAIAGLGNAVIQPATNLALSRTIPRRRQGLAFGVKQTNGPLATLLAGAAVPTIGLTVGWRWAFVAGALGVVAAGALARGVGDTRPASGETGTAASPRSGLWLIAAGAGGGVATAMALVGFFTESAVAAGHTPAVAGTCFAVGSAVGVLARIGWGWLADRRGTDALGWVAALLVVGSGSLALLGAGSDLAVLLTATVLVFVTAWGWVGLLLFGVVRVAPAAPGHATGIINVGISLGGILGPPSFGAMVTAAGYPAAWAAAGAVTLVAGLLVAAGGARCRALAVPATAPSRTVTDAAAAEAAIAGRSVVTTDVEVPQHRTRRSR